MLLCATYYLLFPPCCYFSRVKSIIRSCFPLSTSVKYDLILLKVNLLEESAFALRFKDAKIQKVIKFTEIPERINFTIKLAILLFR